MDANPITRKTQLIYCASKAKILILSKITKTVRAEREREAVQGLMFTL